MRKRLSDYVEPIHFNYSLSQCPQFSRQSFSISWRQYIKVPGALGSLSKAVSAQITLFNSWKNYLFPGWVLGVTLLRETMSRRAEWGMNYHFRKAVRKFAKMSETFSYYCVLYCIPVDLRQAPYGALIEIFDFDFSCLLSGSCCPWRCTVARRSDEAPKPVSNNILSSRLAGPRVALELFTCWCQGPYYE